MQCELLMIGTELLLGQVADTNAAYMGRQLADNGINLYQKTTVGDNPARIVGALNDALARADVVLCSGGLGPTEDDITRECVAEALGWPLEYHPELYDAILARFTRIGRAITENNKRQAMLPRGAEAIENPHGTAPGLIAASNRGVVVCMPGVPHELKPMLDERVIPWLKQRFSIAGVLRYRSLKVCGIGESRVDALMGDLILSGANPTVGLLAGADGVVVRIAARAETAEAAEALMDPVEAEVQKRLGGIAFGRGNDTIESVVDGLLCARGWRMAVAETSTGGTIAQRLLALPAASFVGGYVLAPDETARWIPPGPDEDDTPGGVPFDRQGVDMGRRLLLDFSVTCALALIFEPEAGRTVGTFLCPSGMRHFVLGHYGDGALSQLRLSVAALEQVRRFLVGLPDEV
jgi:nicotinamide-nucleotide amidase